jgi:hypothetical protein
MRARGDGRARCIALLLLTYGTGCGGGGGGGASSNTTAPAKQNSAKALEEVANALYAAQAGGEDLKPYIGGVMTAFGVPPLGEGDVTTADARLGQGLPLIFIPQVAELADAFNDGGSLGLDAFIAAANDRGAQQRGTTLPLTRDFLSRKFAAYAGKSQYQPGQVLPAFVLALGQERARRFPPASPDPLWGDGLLDPLQATLLLYAVSYASAGPLHAQADVPIASAPMSMAALAVVPNPIEGFVRDQLRDVVTGEVQDAVQIPLGEREAAQASLCASLLLYGHKVTVTATPSLIYHRQTDGTAPWSTRLDALLTFQDDYWDNYLAIDRWMLTTLGGCVLPRRGPVEGKPIEWSVSDGLAGHGSYSITPAVTDVDGKGVASWQAVVESTPASRRTFDNQRDAVGAAIVRAGSLVPGWSGLERVVGLLRDTGNTGDAPITVLYYLDPCRAGLAPASRLVNAAAALAAAPTCQDSWSGTSSSTITDATPVYGIAAQVTWVFDPLASYGTKVFYHPEGTATFQVLNSPCLSVSPATSPVTQAEGQLELDLSTNPPTYTASGITGWAATYTDSCPGETGSFPSWAGGAWLAGQGSTSPDGNVIAGTFSSGGQTFTFNFVRN